MSARQYSNKATPATLGGGISSSDTSLSLSTVSGLPASFPYTLVIEPDSVNAEVVTCTALAGTIATVTRGQDGTTAVAHDAGSVVMHDHSARDFQEPQDHMVATVAHGATGAVVGTTNAQTLTNKTVDLASNTVTMTKAQLNTAVSDADVATLTGAETLTNKTVDLANNTVSMTKAQLNTAVSDADVVTLDGTETLTNKTLTSPAIGGTVPGTAAFTTLTAATHVQSPETTGGSARTHAPYASVSQGASQSIVNTSTVQIQFDTDGSSTDAGFANQANERLVIPVTGRYDFQVQIETNDGADYVIYLGILKNGGYVAQTKFSTGSARAFGTFSTVALNVNCVAGDFITADIWHNKGSATSLVGFASGGAVATGTFLLGKWAMPA